MPFQRHFGQSIKSFEQLGPNAIGGIDVVLSYEFPDLSQVLKCLW
jgi:hypothetical protein